MNLTQMTQVANAYTDENMRVNQTLFFANEAIGTINAELDCELPFIESASNDYIALSETWIRQVLIPYISYSIKMNDASLQEAGVFYNSYEQGLERLKNKRKTAIPKDYQKESFSGVWRIDYSQVGVTHNIPVQPAVIADWNEYINYYKDDRVYYNGNYYIAIKDNDGGLPTDTDYWRLIE